MMQILRKAFNDYVADLKRMPGNWLKDLVGMAKSDDEADGVMLYLAIIFVMPITLFFIGLCIMLLIYHHIWGLALIGCCLLPGYIVRVLANIDIKQDSLEDIYD